MKNTRDWQVYSDKRYEKISEIKGGRSHFTHTINKAVEIEAESKAHKYFEDYNYASEIFPEK